MRMAKASGTSIRQGILMAWGKLGHTGPVPSSLLYSLSFRVSS